MNSDESVYCGYDIEYERRRFRTSLRLPDDVPAIDLYEASPPDEGLQPIRFSTVDEFIEVMRHTDGDVQFVQDVGLDDYESLLQATCACVRIEYVASIPGCRITLPTGVHKHLHAVLSDLLLTPLIQMGMPEEGLRRDATIVKPLDDLFPAEADTSSIFSPDRRGLGQWPTLIIETGCSHTLAPLQGRSDWWFQESRWEINVVLLVELDCDNSTIRLQQWCKTPLVPTDTLSRPSFYAKQVSEISITRRTNRDYRELDTYDVVGGPLEVRFEHVNLRPPGLSEHNIIIDDEDLIRMAKQAWSFTLG